MPRKKNGKCEANPEDSNESSDEANVSTTMEQIPVKRLPLPPPFEKFDKAAEDFDAYLDRFTCFMECYAIDENQFTRFFIASVGPQTYSLLKQLCVPKKPSEMQYSELVSKLKTHLNPKPLVDTERHKFGQRMQRENENFSQFLAALKELSVNCEFTGEKCLEEELKRQILAGIRNKHTQNYFFATPGLTLDMVIQKAIADEQAAVGVQYFSKSSTSGISKINKINENIKKKYSPKPSLYNEKPSTSSKPSEEKYLCFSCGRYYHKADDCKFKNTECK